MFEKYLKVLPGTEVEKTILEVYKSRKILSELIKTFREDFSIESDMFVASNSLNVLLTKKDQEKYGSQLEKNTNTFKKDSRLQKEYTKRFKEAGLNECKLDFSLSDCNIFTEGSYGIQHFVYKGNCYLKISSLKDISISNDFEEISSSEISALYEMYEAQ